MGRKPSLLEGLLEALLETLLEADGLAWAKKTPLLDGGMGIGYAIWQGLGSR